MAGMVGQHQRNRQSPITGVTYNLETGETQCIPLEQWHALKEKYNKEAGEHYRICKNPKYNLWRRFNEE